MIHRLAIENLGPIAGAEITLTPLTVLLGANASGKTSVLRAFELFASLRSDPLGAVSLGQIRLSSTQWPVIVHGGDESLALRFRAWTANETEADYEIAIGVNWDAEEGIVRANDQDLRRPVILSDRLRDPDSKGGFITAGTGDYEIRTLRVTAGGPRTMAIPAALEGLSRHPKMSEPLRGVIEFARSLGGARYFKPVGSALVTLTGDARVWPAGEGFVDALGSWQNARVEDFLRLEASLREVFPHIRRIRILRPDLERNRHVLEFETTRSKRLTPAELEADGVLTTLFMLWAAFTTGKNGILLLDDPEAGLHPHLMAQRVEFLRSLATGTLTGDPVRVVAATQSVEFARALDISEVRVTEHRADIGTTIVTPQGEQLTTLLETFRKSVGELWYSGVLGGLPEPRR